MSAFYKWWSKGYETRTFSETICNKSKVGINEFNHFFNRFYK